MKVFVVLASLATLANCGLVAFDTDHGELNKATSYQNIKFEHFHAVPTYIKKEDAHLLKNPIATGNSGAKLEIHHGDKHEPGYAIADTHANIVHPSHDGEEKSEGTNYAHSLNAQGLGVHALKIHDDENEEGNDALSHAALAAQALQNHRGLQHATRFAGRQRPVEYHQLRQAAIATHAAQPSAPTFPAFEYEEGEAEEPKAQPFPTNAGLGHFQ